MAPRPKTAANHIAGPNPGRTFKSEIDDAKLAGIDPSTLLLRLSLSDVSRLKRDRSLAVGDISYLNGQMRFLGVLVAEGEGAVSALVILQS